MEIVEMAKPYIPRVLVFFFALLAVLGIQGAIPFVLAPTTGQAVWSMGFAHSFANSGLLSVHAVNFGAPDPAPIVFGLAGAWPASLMIRAGMHAVDAYATMTALWLTLAFCSAYALARQYSSGHYTAVVAAVCWGTMPMIWGHAGYSMVSIGIGLLSFYFYVFIKLMDSLKRLKNVRMWISLYPCATIIAVFMDGYSFMMFAVGASILMAGLWMGSRDFDVRKRWALVALPVHGLSFVLAYGLYALYIGRSQFDAAPLDFFRGWGVDILFWALPTQGVHWIPDLLGWSVKRSEQLFWGDASVWMTSFSLPVILAGLYALFCTKCERATLWALSAVALFGFYMALGPSLKINAIKPPEAVDQKIMKIEYAKIPTGTGVLSEHLPGFSAMRASYRWGALGVFASWLLLVFALSGAQEWRSKTLVVALLFGVTLINLPHPMTQWSNKQLHRNMFLSIDEGVLATLERDVSPGSVVAFLPWRNDFLVNYLAARLNITTYNIGGDKNFQMARDNWPPIMKDFPIGRVDAEFVNRVLKLIARGEADVVILPYIDMLNAAHVWPQSVEGAQQELRPAITSLAASGVVEVIDRDLYAMVRLKSELIGLPRESLEFFVYRTACIVPVCLRVDGFHEGSPTRVGVARDGMLHSQGKAGMLTFGPYRPLNAGSYEINLKGFGGAVDEAWLDVVSSLGAVSHGKWNLRDIGGPAGTGWTASFKLSEPVENLEVRVGVGVTDEISIRGFEVAPVLDERVLGLALVH